jgi:Domain of unknown function (DUF1906)
MIVRAPAFPSFGIDCVSILTASSCRALKAAGIAFVIRYLDTLTPQERDAVLEAELGLGFCSYSEAGGWLPTDAKGIAGGAQAVAKLRALSIPEGPTVWTDLEGVAKSAAAADVMGWANAHASQITAAGYDAGLYVGAGGGLTGAELFSLEFDKYWRSLSDVPTPSPAGWALLQLFKTTVIAGVAVDVDAVQYDWKDRLPLLVWAD